MIIMKNKLSFLLLAVALIFSACTPELITPNQQIGTVTDRDGTIEVNFQVAAFEIIIDEVIMTLTSFDTDFNDLEVVPTQELFFLDANGNNQTIIVDIESFEIIIDEVIMTFQVPSGGLNGLEIASNQVLDFMN